MTFDAAVQGFELKIVLFIVAFTSNCL